MRSSLLDEDVNDECVPQGSHRICREVPREAASNLSPSGPSTMSSTALMSADVVLDAVYIVTVNHDIITTLFFSRKRSIINVFRRNPAGEFDQIGL